MEPRSDRIRAAAVQLNSTGDRDRNLDVAERLTRAAAAGGAELIVLPEKWTVLGDSETLLAGAEPIDGPAIAAARSWARELGIHLLAGSFAERVAGEEKLSNTSLLITAEGEIAAAYRKLHMFDVDVGGVSYRESNHERPGDEIVLGEIVRPGAEPVPLGLTVCYDLRFPELYRILALRGALAVAIPSAFTLETGRDHWEVLVRARAIENQLFAIAAGQIGESRPGYRSYGRSMIADPWGVPLAIAPDEECFVVADLDFERLRRIRASLPSLANRRPQAYRWPSEAPRPSAGPEEREAAGKAARAEKEVVA